MKISKLQLRTIIAEELKNVFKDGHPSTLSERWGSELNRLGAELAPAAAAVAAQPSTISHVPSRVQAQLKPHITDDPATSDFPVEGQLDLEGAAIEVMPEPSGEIADPGPEPLDPEEAKSFESFMRWLHRDGDVEHDVAP